MKTQFSATQLADPAIAEADSILGTCQHFGFCTSGCPTYVLLHDENDGPRGRIDLIKAMLESDAPPSAKTVSHIDKCLSCMSCMSTCAVKVDYLHLVDIARTHIENTYQRPWKERLMRRTLAHVLPRPAWFRKALALGRLGAKFSRLVPPSMRHYLDLLPPAASTSLAHHLPEQACYPAQGKQKWRVALLAGCVQPTLSPNINAATIRLLTRLGCEVVIPPGAACCGSLNLHMGRQADAQAAARRNVNAWSKAQAQGLDAILSNASGCGSTIKDYGHLLQQDAHLAQTAQQLAAISMDVTEWLVKITAPAPESPKRFKVAYHDACSLRNVQKVTQPPRKLLRQAGFQVEDIPEAHFCCGSAGTYNLLQPSLARQLGERKAANIAGLAPQIIAAGNIGCITQIRLYSQAPIVHTLELLDWAYGGPCPPALQGLTLIEQDETASPADTASTSAPLTFLPNADNTNHDDVGVW